MNTPNDSTAPRGLREWWASPPRSGLRRIIAPWEYRHLRGWAAIRLGCSMTLASLAIITFAFGGNYPKTYGFAAVFLAAAVAHFSFAQWELAIARSRSASA